LVTRNKNGNKTVAVNTYTVTKTEVIKNITASGKTEAKRALVVNSPVTAKVAALPFESGDLVKKGDVIVKFDYNSLKASADSAYSAYLTAKASADTIDNQISAAKKAADDYKFKRDKAWREYMGDDGDSTKQAYKTAESNYRSAESTLISLQNKKSSIEESSNAASEAYNVTRDNLNNVYVRAPEDGLLALEGINTNDSILGGQKLFTVSNSNGLRFNAEVDETDIENIKIGEPVVITLDAFPNDSFKGTVERMDAKTRVTSNGSTIVDVDINFSLQEKRPIVGMSGSAEIEVGKESAQIAVPFDAILFGDSGKDYIFTVNKDTMTVNKVEVVLGFEGNDYYVIKSGINEGDIVVTGNEITGLADGSKITFTKTK
jgi:RND family efflux transporter MFP subunit